MAMLCLVLMFLGLPKDAIELDTQTDDPSPLVKVTSEQIYLAEFDRLNTFDMEGNLINQLDLEDISYLEEAQSPRISNFTPLSKKHGYKVFLVVTGLKQGAREYFFRSFLLGEDGHSAELIYDSRLTDPKAVYFRNVFELPDGRLIANCFNGKIERNQFAVELREITLIEANQSYFPGVEDWEPGLEAAMGEPLFRKFFDVGSPMQDHKQVLVSQAKGKEGPVYLVYPYETRIHILDSEDVRKTGFAHFDIPGNLAKDGPIDTQSGTKPNFKITGFLATDNGFSFVYELGAGNQKHLRLMNPVSGKRPIATEMTIDTTEHGQKLATSYAGSVEGKVYFYRKEGIRHFMEWFSY